MDLFQQNVERNGSKKMTEFAQEIAAPIKSAIVKKTNVLVKMVRKIWKSKDDLNQ